MKKCLYCGKLYEPYDEEINSFTEEIDLPLCSKCWKDNVACHYEENN